MLKSEYPEKLPAHTKEHAKLLTVLTESLMLGPMVLCSATVLSFVILNAQQNIYHLLFLLTCDGCYGNLLLGSLHP